MSDSDPIRFGSDSVRFFFLEVLVRAYRGERLRRIGINIARMIRWIHTHSEGKGSLREQTAAVGLWSTTGDDRPISWSVLAGPCKVTALSSRPKAPISKHLAGPSPPVVRSSRTITSRVGSDWAGAGAGAGAAGPMVAGRRSLHALAAADSSACCRPPAPGLGRRTGKNSHRRPPDAGQGCSVGTDPVRRPASPAQLGPALRR